MMMTHVFRCIDAVFTALPNICMLGCNRGTINQARSLEHTLGKSREKTVTFTQCNITLEHQELSFSFGTKPLLMVILLFFCSCNFAEKSRNLSSFVVLHAHFHANGVFWGLFSNAIQRSFTQAYRIWLHLTVVQGVPTNLE